MPRKVNTAAASGKADAAMRPIALSWDATDSSFRSPMSVAVIGVRITSTVLSLLVVLAVFTYKDDLEHRFQRMAGKVRQSPPPTQTPAPPATHSPHSPRQTRPRRTA